MAASFLMLTSPQAQIALAQAQRAQQHVAEHHDEAPDAPMTADDAQWQAELLTKMKGTGQGRLAQTPGGSTAEVVDQAQGLSLLAKLLSPQLHGIPTPQQAYSKPDPNAHAHVDDNSESDDDDDDSDGDDKSSGSATSCDREGESHASGNTGHRGGEDDPTAAPGSRKFTSNFHGVSWHKRSQRWAVQIRNSGKRIHVGYFSDERRAASAYDKVAKELRGDRARVNFDPSGSQTTTKRRRRGSKSAAANAASSVEVAHAAVGTADHFLAAQPTSQGLPRTSSGHLLSHAGSASNGLSSLPSAQKQSSAMLMPFVHSDDDMAQLHDSKVSRQAVDLYFLQERFNACRQDRAKRRSRISILR